MWPWELCLGLHSAGKSGLPTIRVWPLVLQIDHIYVQHGFYTAAAAVCPARASSIASTWPVMHCGSSPIPHAVMVRGPLVVQKRMFVRLQLTCVDKLAPPAWRGVCYQMCVCQLPMEDFSVCDAVVACAGRGSQDCYLGEMCLRHDIKTDWNAPLSLCPPLRDPQ